MDRLHARYPFLDAAREAVEAADVDLLDLAEGGGPAVDRAVERVEASLSGGGVGPPVEADRHEVLSYPVARVLVSLVDRPALVRRYADAEARTAHERFREDLTAGDDLRSTSAERPTLRRLLAEFDLTGAVQGSLGDGEFAPGATYRVGVGAYLSLSAELDGGAWRLPTRRLADGLVPVSGEELLVLLREAVRERVAAGLPFEEVPDAVAAALEPEVERLREGLADHRPPGRVDAVVPELFPPCMAALAERALAGEDLPAHSRYALVAFLTSAGVGPEAIREAFPEGLADTAAYQAERLGGDAGGGYAPPTCPTMQSYGDGEASFGDCVAPAERDPRCGEVPDPLTFYAEALADADDPAEWDGTAPLAERLP